MEPTSVGGNTQCAFGEVLVGERSQGHEPLRSSDGGHDKSIEVVEHETGEQLAEWPGVAPVGCSQGAEVSTSVSQVDDCRGAPEAKQEQVEQQAASPAVPVRERVDTLELAV
ncbi:MAG TPA: hypothetical protein VGL92_17605 [Acidimicrobiia bacterium]